LLLKHIFALSDEQVCERWIYDPYFQYFTGEEFFQHVFPHERSDLSHWRNRIGDKLELLLAESLRIAHQTGALRTNDLARVTVDTTVQPKAITFPTDAKLLHAAIKALNRVARKHGVRLRQSYLRIAKHAAMMAGRYAHAKQFKRHRRELRILRSRLGRIIRDIRRKIAGQADIEAGFEWPLARANQIRFQQQRQRGWKLYSFHAPEVECIGKGKASAPYEFGVKQSLRRPHARRCHRRHRKAHRLPDRARLCRQGIPRPRHRKPTPRFHLRPEARRVRRHQTRTSTAFRHRGRDRPHED
jgi:IS5 family transposase